MSSSLVEVVAKWLRCEPERLGRRVFVSNRSSRIPIEVKFYSCLPQKVKCCKCRLLRNATAAARIEHAYSKPCSRAPRPIGRPVYSAMLERVKELQMIELNQALSTAGYLVVIVTLGTQAP